MEDKPANIVSHKATLQYLSDLKSLKSLKLTLFDYMWSGSELTGAPNNKLFNFALHVHQSVITTHSPKTDYISKFGKISKIKKLELELPLALDNMDLSNMNEVWSSITHLIVSLQHFHSNTR